MSNYAYFGSYAYIRTLFTPREDGKLAMGASVTAGGLAGICYWLSCYPFDVVKNKMMVRGWDVCFTASLRMHSIFHLFVRLFTFLLSFYSLDKDCA